MSSDAIPKLRMTMTIFTESGGKAAVTERLSDVLLIVESKTAGPRDVALTLTEAATLAQQLVRIVRRVRNRPEDHP